MIKVKLIATSVIVFLLPFICMAQNFGGNAPSVKWKQINTSKAKIIFPQGLDSQANRIANVVQLMDSATSKTIGGSQRKWNIILQNQTTIPNAYVRMAPIMSELFMTPGQDNFNTGSVRWDDNLITHENRHMQQFSNFNKGLTKLFSFFLGQEGQLFANGLFLPDYFFEGDAVWQETLVSAQGRGRMPAFFNGFKSLWLENKKYSWMKYRSGSLKDFVPDHYPLGYILVAYGYEKYGENFWNNVTNDAVRFKSFFNKAIEKHSGVPFKQFRQDAVNFFKEKSFLEEKTTTDYNYLTGIKKNNVIDYLFPNFIGDDSILVTKKSYKEIEAFYLLANGKEEKIRVKNLAIDDYYSYKNGKVVYASYQSDPRWGNRDYSVLQLLDIKSKQQKQLTFKSKYFSPDINAEGNEILAVSVNTDGTNNLHRLNATTGEVILKVPNPQNYFFTQTKYVNNTAAVSAIRNPEGNMALVKVDLTNGTTELLTPFSFNVLGYPSVKNDTVYFSRMDNNADKIFAVSLKDKKIFRLTNNSNGIYHPAANSKGELVFTSFTAEGNRLSKAIVNQLQWQKVTAVDFIAIPDLYTARALKKEGARSLYALTEKQNAITKYKKSSYLFNFHSRRPVIGDPEFGYSLYSDNVLSSFSNILSYTYNRNDKSHTLGISSVFAGWFPVLSVGAEESFNRTIDTALGKSIIFNSATLKTGFSIPLNFIGGRTNKFLNFGAGYNIEQYLYSGISKNIFNNKAINYGNAFFSFSNVSRRAVQYINPRWAQSIAVNYRDAFNFRNSHKLVANTALYFPGFAVNHSLVINGAYQKRDTLPDLFSNIFSFARGYEALSTRRMYKLGFNYHFPLCYPDWGVGGVIYFQRIRANAFYDYNNSLARFSNGRLTEIINRSTGAELYFDTKVWNSLPVSIGVRFAHLLDTDLLNPGVKNRWEIIVPIGLIPN
ncbi:TolB-like translocation protein [Ferruginibacter sp.]